MAGGLGFFAGGLSDSLSAGMSRNQQYDFQQKELALQQQGQQMAQQRFDLSRLDNLITAGIQNITETISEAKAVGEDPKLIQSTIQQLQDNVRRLAVRAGRPAEMVDAQVAAAWARPSPTSVMKAEAAAKESPSLAALRKAQADPFGLEGGAGTGTVAPPNNTFQPGEQITGIDVKESPPTSIAQATPTATAQTPEEAKGDAFLNSIPNQRLAAAVKAVANYEVNPNAFLSRGTMASRAQFLGLVQQYAESRGQTYDQTNFTAKNKAMQGFATRVQAISLADSELRKILPILRETSNAVDRTKYSDLNSVIEAAQRRTGGEAVIQFGENINSVINLYARAINPTGGKPTVNDLKNAEGILQKEWSKGQIEAGIQNMLRVIDATKASLPAARNEILGILSGQDQKESSKTPQYKFNPQTGELE